MENVWAEVAGDGRNAAAALGTVGTDLRAAVGVAADVVVGPLPAERQVLVGVQLGGEMELLRVGHLRIQG